MERNERNDFSGEENRSLWFQSVQGMADGKRVLVGNEALYYPGRRLVQVRYWGPEAPESEIFYIPPEISGENELLIHLYRMEAPVPYYRLRQALEASGISEKLFRLQGEAEDLGYRLREAELTPALLEELIRLSEAWEAEDSCWGYRKNTAEDIEGNRVFLLERGEEILGYLFGHEAKAERSSSVMPEGTPFFEVEELYVKPRWRSYGYGTMLFQFAEETLRGQVDYLLLSTATKNWQAILHFYLEELDMQFWSARLFKKLE